MPSAAHKTEEMLVFLRDTAEEAGRLILAHYSGSREKRLKEDRSPVTDADMEAHHHILKALSTRTPDIPVVSEEGVLPSPDMLPQQFWLVDPLDGTKSFVRGSGQFTVNIALVERAAPLLGMVHVPLLGVTYYGAADTGAWKREQGASDQRIMCRAVPKEKLVTVESHAHRSPHMEAFLAPYDIGARSSASSSVKFCTLAEGEADMYPRLGQTMEWDTAAGHAIVLGAGGSVTTMDGAPLTYGKPRYLNPDFVAWGKR